MTPKREREWKRWKLRKGEALQVGEVVIRIDPEHERPAYLEICDPNLRVQYLGANGQARKPRRPPPEIGEWDGPEAA